MFGQSSGNGSGLPSSPGSYLGPIKFRTAIVIFLLIGLAVWVYRR